jgi:aldehyde dehydrogenase (NAD+)
MTTTLTRRDLLIGGRAQPAESGERFTVTDPSTGEPLAEVASAGGGDVAEAVAAARDAQKGWAGAAPRERGAILLAAARIIRDRAEELAHWEARDTGKPLAQARADADVAAQYCEFYGGLADKVYGDAIPLEGSNFAITFREPLGVTGHIIPWNYPLQIGARTVAPALAMGNTCVVKPAEEAPLTTGMLGEIFLEASLPAGVLNIVPGLGEVAGAALAASDEIDHISFTGGVDTGKLVMGAAAHNLKPITMELGGKSPSIVLADADLDRAVPVITKALIQNSGQTCSAGTRVVVDRSRHEELVERLADSFSRVRLGAGVDNPDMGPVISGDQLERVLGYLDVARDEGARFAIGGGRAEPDGKEGFFVNPTVLDGVTPDMRIAREEVFGPVLSILDAGDEADALRIADDTPYGLIAAIWTTSVDRAMWLARHLKCGQVYINSYGAGGGVPLPFGGYKKSGFGREKGVEAAYEYSQVKTVALDVRSPEGSGGRTATGQ